MDDNEIVELLYRHSETGLEETQAKYRKLLFSVCSAILSDGCDAEECVNDTYLKIWSIIPPYRPPHFRPFLCKIARQIAIDRYRRNHSAKSNTNSTVSYDEIDEEFPDENFSNIQVSDLSAEIDKFTGELDVQSRVLFIRRYFFSESQADLAKRFEMNENAVNAKLFRLRNKLKKQLIERGYFNNHVENT